MRGLPLRELGIPPEYIPTSYGKSSSDVEQAVTCGPLENREHGSLGVVAGGSASNSAVSGIAAEQVRVIDSVTERRMEGVSHEACPKEDETEDPGHQGEPATAVVPVAPTSDGIEASKATPTANLTAGRVLAEEEGNVDAGIEGGVDIPYECVLQEFGRLGSCTTPAEMLEVVEAAMILLAKEAARLSVGFWRYWVHFPVLCQSTTKLYKASTGVTFS